MRITDLTISNNTYMGEDVTKNDKYIEAYYQYQVHYKGLFTLCCVFLHWLLGQKKKGRIRHKPDQNSAVWNPLAIIGCVCPPLRSLEFFWMKWPMLAACI
ncbi:hypothetical protein GDO78_011988 [Eleutherodactylus coqui]|uniref:Uncharacterized protein n=1 Tax=Eleutherodactylus coqui TaxID=57060 RepID=A0A8J6F4M2_ELECQ|nr:hypothetical protein GDO78_011988 [Eleutherodactylus coqui]